MEDVIAKNLLCGRTCFNCHHYIDSRPGDMTIEIAHCTKSWEEPENNTCELWMSKGSNLSGEFAALRELMKTELPK